MANILPILVVLPYVVSTIRYRSRSKIQVFQCFFKLFDTNKLRVFQLPITRFASKTLLFLSRNNCAIFVTIFATMAQTAMFCVYIFHLLPLKIYPK
ncbi:MAG: hypothetical protein [Myoviridae sp. ctThM1]|nr:MAG: hypothetical protein [Myoviridae sp. ctThM1]